MDMDGWLCVADSCFVCQTVELALAVPFKEFLLVRRASLLAWADMSSRALRTHVKSSHAGEKDIKSSDWYAKGSEREHIKSWAKPKSPQACSTSHTIQGGGGVLGGVRWRWRQSVLCLLFLLSYSVSHSPSNKNVTTSLLVLRGNRWSASHFIMSSK